MRKRREILCRTLTLKHEREREREREEEERGRKVLQMLDALYKIYYVNAIITYALSDDFLIFSLSLHFPHFLLPSSSSPHKYVDI
jgi:hypothetical protein